MASNKYLVHFNSTQKGGAIPSVFAGKQLMMGYGLDAQRGAGIGQLLGSVFRSIVPVLKSNVLPVVKRAVKTSSKELARSGARILQSVALDEDPKVAAQNELKRLKRRAAEEIVKEIDGSDAKKTRKSSRKRAATKAKRKGQAPKRKSRDIFD